MRNFWHYIKDNDYPNDMYDKLLVIKDDSCDEPPMLGYKYAIGYYRKDINMWDNTDYGFIKDSENVVAWCEPPMISRLNIESE